LNTLHFNKEDLKGLERFYRANLINSASGFKPANLIGTVSDTGVTNLAIFSSVVHLGADPALLAFVQRPLGESGHTYYNIKKNGFYTINHIHRSFAPKAHFSSAKFPDNVSEFEACHLQEEWLASFPAPFVRESRIKIGMRFVQEIPIALNNTILIIGEIEHLLIDQTVLMPDGRMALETVEDVCISGLDTYYVAQPLVSLPYAKTTHTHLTNTDV
jgi:flavin reductase (DIM6/NTAB) family NADH-FMN oxidoreductase RutF